MKRGVFGCLAVGVAVLALGGCTMQERAANAQACLDHPGGLACAFASPSDVRASKVSRSTAIAEIAALGFEANPNPTGAGIVIKNPAFYSYNIGPLSPTAALAEARHMADQYAQKARDDAQRERHHREVEAQVARDREIAEKLCPKVEPSTILGAYNAPDLHYLEHPFVFTRVSGIVPTRIQPAIQSFIDGRPDEPGCTTFISGHTTDGAPVAATIPVVFSISPVTGELARYRKLP